MSTSCVMERLEQPPNATMPGAVEGLKHKDRSDDDDDDVETGSAVLSTMPTDTDLSIISSDHHQQQHPDETTIIFVNEAVAESQLIMSRCSSSSSSSSSSSNRSNHNNMEDHRRNHDDDDEDDDDYSNANSNKLSEFVAPLKETEESRSPRSISKSILRKSHLHHHPPNHHHHRIQKTHSDVGSVDSIRSECRSVSFDVPDDSPHTNMQQKQQPLSSINNNNNNREGTRMSLFQEEPDDSDCSFIDSSPRITKPTAYYEGNRNYLEREESESYLRNNNNESQSSHNHKKKQGPASMTRSKSNRRHSNGGRSHRRSSVPKNASLSHRFSRAVDKRTTSCFSKLFGETYSKREGVIVLIAGALLAFNSGFVNGSTLSGFLTPTRTESVSAYTTPYTRAAFAVAMGDVIDFGYYIFFLLSYFFGSFIAGIITPNGTPFQIEPTYGPTFLIGGVFLMTASILAAFESEPTYIFFLAAAANGIQNGIASIYSANLIRCSLTGASTDVALVIAQCCRGNRKQLWKGLVLFSIIACFWLGGLISFYMTRRFLTYTLFFNAVLFWLIGLGLVYFLVRELDITVRAAISGSWQWKQAIGSLHESIQNNKLGNSLNRSNSYSNNASEGGGGGGGGDHSGNSGSEGDVPCQLSQESLFDMFDEIDDDGNGEIEPGELLDALLKADVKINAKGVMVLIKAADDNGDGMINREEWLKIVQKMER